MHVVSEVQVQVVSRVFASRPVDLVLWIWVGPLDCISTLFLMWHSDSELCRRSLSGCDKLSPAGVALALAPMTQLLDLDVSYIGEAPPEDEDVATTRELREANGGRGYSTWVRSWYPHIVCPCATARIWCQSCKS